MENDILFFKINFYNVLRTKSATKNWGRILQVILNDFLNNCFTMLYNKNVILLSLEKNDRNSKTHTSGF